MADAVSASDLELVKDLASRKPELMLAKDGDGNTPLVFAIEECQWTIAQWLADHSAAKHFINVCGSAGHLPLQLAVQAKRAALVDSLLEAGADPNGKSTRSNEYNSGRYDKLDAATGAKLAISAEQRTA